MSTTYNRSDGAQSDLVIEATADLTLLRSQCPVEVNNLGAAGAVVITLPQDAKSGDTVKGFVAAAQTLKFDPGAAGAIFINGAKQTDDKQIISSGIGSRVTLMADGNGDWHASNYWSQEVSVEYIATSVDKRFYCANRSGSVVDARLTPNVAGTDAGAVSAMPVKVASGSAVAGATSLLTSTFDLKGTVNTVQQGTLTVTVADRDFVAGNCLGFDFTGVMTAATGVGTLLLSEWRVEA